jgi:hypothetical protein
MGNLSGQSRATYDPGQAIIATQPVWPARH